MDYPIITYAEFNGTYLYVEGFIGFANAIVDVYLVNNSVGGDDLVGNNISSDGSTLGEYYGEGWIYLGTLTANADGNFSGWIDVTGKGVENCALITATATLSGKGTSEFGPDYQLIKWINVSAGITLFWQGDSLNATIYVHAYKDVKFIKVYWIKPSNFTITSMNGEYDDNGSIGNVYWWMFDSISEGETRYIYLKLNSTGDFWLLDAYNVGVDLVR
jgi:hypothetical protein